PPVNHPPTATPTMSTPDQTTGTVSGSVNGSDADGNTLSYTVSGAPASGSVMMNVATGTFIYTPTQAARLLAGTTAGPDVDNFTVAISDGQTSTPVSVSVTVSAALVSAPTSKQVGSSPIGVAVSATKTYVANQGSNTISVIDRANPSATPVTVNVVSSPRVMALSADGSRLFVGGINAVSVINTATNTVVGTVTTNAGQINGIAVYSPAGSQQQKVYVSNQNTNTVSVITATPATDSYAISATISGQSLPTGLALSTDGSKLYVANWNSASVRVINTATNQPIGNSIAVGANPFGLAISPDGSRLYTSNWGSSTVSVINTTTPTPTVSSIAVGPNPFGIALSPDGSVLYAPNANDTVSVINTKTNTVITTASVDAAPEYQWHNIAVSPDGRVLYVSDMADGQLRTLTIAGANTAPVAGTPTISTPNASTGAVTVALNFTDPDGDTLTYTTTQPATGTVTITGPGVYTFTPTQAARDAATTPQGVHSTTFTITASDGKAATTVPVTVAIAPAANSDGVFALGSVTMTGQRPGSLVVTADGTRALLVTGWPIGPVTQQSYPNGTGGSTTRVAVIDTTSGNQIGTTFTFTGPQPIAPVLSADGTRAYIVSTGTGTGSVTEINTTTGTQIGTTLTLTGGSSSSLVLSPDGTRALFTTGAYSATTNTTTTRVAVLNTSTGTQTGTILTLNGVSVYGPTFSPDGSRVLITTDVVTTVDNVAVINTVTGTQTGTTLTVNGALLYAPTLSPDGSRAVITARDYTADTTGMTVFNMTTGTQIGTTLTLAGTGSVQQVSPDSTRQLLSSSVYVGNGAYTTRLAVFDTTTGTQVGSTLTLTGTRAYDSVTPTPDGRHLLITADATDAATGQKTTRLTVFDTTTGTQTGTTLNLTGAVPYSYVPIFSPDGTKALITTDVYDSTTSLHTGRVTMINTSTGSQIGTPIALTGSTFAFATWRADGSRALITITPTQYDTVVAPMLVAVIDSAGNQIGTTLSLSGMPNYGTLPVWSSDGTRVVITTSANQAGGGSTTRVTTINTTNGTQTGTTVILASSLYGGRTNLIPGGNRAMITAGDQVALIDLTNGSQIGTTIALNGTPAGILFSANGSRAVITSATGVTVINTSTGAEVGTGLTLTPNGRSIVTSLTPDGTHALVTTDRRYIGDPGVPSTPVAVIDTITGSQVGTTLDLIGDTYAPPAFTPDGTHALITTSEDNAATGVSATRVITINTATGAEVGTTVFLSGVLASGVGNPIGVVLSPDGTRALVATSPNTGGSTSRAAIIDTATGTQIGSAVTINGAVSGLKWSPDGTRVFVTTYITTATGADMNVQETVLQVF
ncbi:MAG: hypothetical protein QOH60_5390, partial [Mycobacterium sp.]|nr:hypothetical protein [Mycobacterium sp.]